MASANPVPGAPGSGEITMLLRRLSSGDRDAEEQLIRHIYRDLRRLAARYLRGERANHTLQPTALVHEAYLRLVGAGNVQWEGRSHFFRVAANIMRRILVDYARNMKAEKRGGQVVKVPLEEFLGAADQLRETIVDVDRALDRLAAIDERQAKVVEMRFFAGLSEEEIARALRLSKRTVTREWTMAKAWLRGELGADKGSVL
ncbi:MAG TPA: sigma-70 family RNA polymerase sigma factor [Bryobacteraceae bacterium]|nr:sigma-70 family RNA polymerase sigma factor [Bryobacteraceae bacterium]